MNTEQVTLIIEAMNAEMADTRKRFQEKMQSVFKDAFKSYFEQNPEVTAVIWRQYTPYFNDGDACVFRCYAGYAAHTNAPDPENVQWGEYNGENEGVWVYDPDYGSSGDVPKKVETAADQFNRLLNKIEDDVFLSTFGDHCIVRATRDGFDVDEYDHD